MPDLPEGWERAKNGRLYDRANKKFASVADADAIGVPFIDPAFKKPARLKTARNPDAPKVTIDPAPVKQPKGPKSVKGSEPVDEPKAKPSAKSAVKEDQADLKELLGQACDTIANVTSFPYFRITEDDADRVARPAARILARNRQLDRAVKTYSDPALLLMAIVAVFGVRMLAFLAWNKAGRPPLAPIGEAPAGQRPVPTPPPPPPPPAPAEPPAGVHKAYGNGRASDATASAIDRIQNMP